MNLDKIRIENYKSFGNTTSEIDLSFIGKKLLIGKNGVGKTSIFEALVWGIYGKTELKADNVVNKFTKANCKVEVFFETAGKNYVITRYRKHNVHGNNIYLFEDGENITPRTATDTQFLIEEIIGIDYRALISSVVLSSETYRNFLRETNSVRLSIFDSVFSLKEIMDYSKITKNKIKEIRKKNTSLENNLATINGSISSLVSGLKSYKESHEEKINNIKNTINKLKKELEEKNEYLNEVSSVNVDEEKTKLLENDKSIQRKIFLEEKLSEIGNINSISLEIKNIELNLDKLNNELKKLEEIDVEKEKEEVLRYDKLKIALDKVNKILDGERSKLSSLEADRVRNDKLVFETEEKLNQLTKKLEKGKESKNICPVCESIIAEGKYKEIIKKDEEEYFNTFEYLGEIKRQDEYFDLEISKVQDTISKIEKKVPKINEPKYTLVYLTEVSSEISKAKYKIENLEKQKDTLEKDYNDKSIRKESIEKEIGELPFISSTFSSVSELDEISSKISNAKLEIRVLEEKINQNEEQIRGGIDKKYVTSVANSINAKKEEKAGIDKSIEENLEDLKYFTALEDVFSNGDEGFKKYFIENSIDIFNENINMYLPFFFEDDIKIIFDKNLSEEIEFKGLPTEWNELSSGQKTRAELAVVFSLFMMVRVLFGSGTNLLVLDEIIDQNLDSDGVNSVVNILNNIANDSAVFIVSHRDDYKERFEDILKVELDGNGFTKVS